MPKPIIEVENLSKLYRLGVIGSTTLRDSVERWWYRARGREEMCQKIGAKHLMIEPDDPQAGPEPNTLWALKDISFSVQRGEIIGIIGKNGAGKSTLLKILTRITEPTSGRAVIRGRTSSMLEVGTGFHPELTGRENIYLNGAILGMRKSEINRKFDEIVDFSGIEKFIDTPVKRYSSGMYVRLAFAVAAHLEPEVLLVDEVLAVGDYDFQKKCIGKMGDVAREGRTVIFVSHNMPSVLRLCKRVVLLDKGHIVCDGDVPTVVKRYLQRGIKTPAEQIWQDIEKAPGDDVARLKAVRAVNRDGVVSETIDIEQSVGVEIEYCNLQSDAHLLTNIHFFNDEGICLFVSADTNEERNRLLSVGVFKRTCWIPGNFLAEGRIWVNAYVSSLNPPKAHAVEYDAVSFQVVDKTKGTGVRGKYANEWPGVVRPLLRWTSN